MITTERSEPPDTGMRRIARATREQDAGVVAIYVALLLPVLMIFAAFAVDVSRWYVELQRLQKSADSAALAAAPFMPDNLGTSSPAVKAAIESARRNGYTIPASAVTQGARPSQVRVTINSTVQNGLASVIGIATTSLSRSAVGEFTGPAPMGSPCNTLGNQPPSSGSPASVQPAVPFASCPGGSSPSGKFWSTILGPEQSKVQGDQFMTRRCTTTGSDNCVSQPGPDNEDFEPRGYYAVVGVSQAVVNAGRTVTVQLYDPAWVNIGGDCTGLPTGVADGMNPYAPDAVLRYERTRISQFCAGDQDANSSGDGNGGAGRVDTSFALLTPNDSLDPTRSVAVTDAVGEVCVRQFRGYTAGPTLNSLTATSPQYNQDLALVTNQWVTLCSFTPTTAGDHYLQFRTNVPLGGTASTNTGGNVPGIYTGNTQVYLQSGDSAQTGRGNNNFAIRAYTGLPTSAQTAGDLTVAGFQRLPLFQNIPAGTVAPPRFNLIRVLPGAAGQTIQFTYFDVAEGSSSNSFVRVLPPVDVTGSLASSTTALGCTASGPVNGSDPDCTLPISASANNGRIQILRVPIPADYGCSATSQGGCWFRLEVSFGPGAAVNDTTTWTAVLDGDPVRLEE